jgi:hypothetical protein
MKITVNNQAELDAIADDFEGEIHIIGSLYEIKRAFKNASVYVSGNAQISNVSGNAQISNVSGNAQIRNVSGNAQIRNVSENAQISNVSENAQIRNVSGNAQIRNVSENAQISNVSGNAQISNVYENAQIRNVSENAQIRYVSGNAQISNVSENAQIRYVSGNAQIRNVSGNAQIRYVYENAQIRNVSGNAQISNVSGNAQIRNVYGNAQIRYVSGNAQISNVYGNASILHCSGKASIETFGQNIISRNKSEDKVKINASKDTVVFLLDEFNASFNAYKGFFPVKTKDNVAILYKAVKKIDGKYIAAHDGKFEYKIGEVATEKCDPSKERSCTYGLHVSHRMWALNFGKDWDNMALLECEVPIDKIVVAKDCDGKVRTSELKVIREIEQKDWYNN